MLVVHQLWTLHALLQKTDIINEHIAHHVDLGKLGALLVGDAVVGYTRSKEDIRQSVDNQSVDFLGHSDVEATGACGNMCQQNALLLGNDGCSHGRGKVVDHYNHIRRILLQIKLELRHDLSCEFVEILAVHT